MAPVGGTFLCGNVQTHTACAGKVFLAQLSDGFLCVPTALL